MGDPSYFTGVHTKRMPLGWRYPLKHNNDIQNEQSTLRETTHKFTQRQCLTNILRFFVNIDNMWTMYRLKVDACLVNDTAN